MTTTTDEPLLATLRKLGQPMKTQLEIAARECGFLLHNIPEEVLGRMAMRISCLDNGHEPTRETPARIYGESRICATEMRNIERHGGRHGEVALACVATRYALGRGISLPSPSMEC